MKAKGFTLIELLVVIAIIGLLSSVVLATLSASRVRSRDAQRVAGVKQLMLALQFYYDATGHFPQSSTCGATVPNTGWCNSVESLSNGHWIKDGGTANVLSPYITNEPKDPIPSTPVATGWSTNGGAYYYFSSMNPQYNGMYIIEFHIEKSPHPLESIDGIYDCNNNVYDYGNGTNGAITIGQSCPK